MAKRFFVRVVALDEYTFTIRLPNGTTAGGSRSDVPPIKIGDVIPASVSNSGNLLIHFDEKKEG